MARHPYPEVAAEVVRLIDGDSLGIPRGHGAAGAFRGLSKRMNFDSTTDLSNLYSAFLNLCLYGFLDRAVPAALALRAVPNGTPMVLYGYLNTCITLTCRFAARAGDTESAQLLHELALNAPGVPYRPKPRTIDGSLLNDLFSKPGVDHGQRVGDALNDVAMLCDMWVFGSPAPEWTRERIDATIDADVAGILGLEKWRPWR
ncbi:MAG: hypothetical protein QM779_07420 [Propionicimonas sp.]|uniref:hypothetical protein n=1 Tax=Propionicimonas sp. TaxID=1955623 RepID=UPI003D0C544A